MSGEYQMFTAWAKRSGLKVNLKAGDKAALTLLAGLLALAGTAKADDKPAVGHLNGKMELIGGKLDGDGAGALAGSIAFPIGKSFGGQIDALGGRVGDNNAFGGGAHLFWRDPDTALIGLTASRTRFGNADMNRFGAEAELYLGSTTLNAFGGIQNGDVDTSFYGGVGALYYPTDDLVLNAGFTGGKDTTSITAGVEWRPSALPSGVSFFAQGNLASDDGDAVFAGFKWYLGKKKSLKRRHREDDPINPLFGSITSSLSELQTLSCGDPAAVVSNGRNCQGDVVVEQGGSSQGD